MLRIDIDDLQDNGTKGDWCFMRGDSYMGILFGDNPLRDIVIIPIARAPSQDKKPWIWNGSREFPTLSPSIKVERAEGWTDGWHGYLREGKLVTA